MKRTVGAGRSDILYWWVLVICNKHSSMSKVAHGIGQTKYHDDREENIVGTTEKLRDNLEQCLKEGRCDEKLRCAQTVMTFLTSIELVNIELSLSPLSGERRCPWTTKPSQQ